MTLHHLREGTGQPLVLIHGVGHYGEGWRPVIDRLAPRFDVIAPDSAGFGRSAPLPAGVDPTILAHTDAFEELFADLGLERPHVAGNSMGGAIALELVRRGAVASATAISPAGFWTAAERRYCQVSLGSFLTMPKVVKAATLRAARTRRGRKALFGQLFAHPDRMPAEVAARTLEEAWASPAFAQTLDAFTQYRFGAFPEPAGVPVTIAWGNRDRLLLYGRQAPRARGELPWARHVTLNGGHTPFYDAPDAVADVIAQTAQPS